LWTFSQRDLVESCATPRSDPAMVKTIAANNIQFNLIEF